jgi:hypothetical protein
VPGSPGNKRVVEKSGFWFARDNAQAIGGAVGLLLLGLFVGGFIGLVEDLLQLTKLWEVFEIFDEEAPAVASF